jgi:hypothetical protein
MQGKHIECKIMGMDVQFKESNPNNFMTRRASSMMILADAQEAAADIKPPPMFVKSLVYLDDYDNTHMGAKSNNLKTLRQKMNPDIKLPQSCTIPFQVLEYTLKQ